MGTFLKIDKLKVSLSLGKSTAGRWRIMDKDYKETERKVICVHGENLLIKVSGLFMGKYSTTAF